MKTREWLDDVEDELIIAGVKVKWEKYDLLNWASAELNRISGEFDADCFNVHLDPIIDTVEGTRYYNLPANFGLNFSPYGGPDGEGYCCMFNDGDNETQLEYVANAQFFTLNLAGESDGSPTKYTILSTPSGGKQIGLSPPPDDSYEIDGLYKPTDWDLTMMDSIPPLPGNSAILKYAVLRRMDRNKWNQDYVTAYASLAMQIANDKKGRFNPYLGPGRNDYALIR